MQSHAWPPVAVVGAGAVGCYFGGMLARAGVPVTLIGRPEHMDAVAKDGLRIEGIRLHERISVGASTSIDCTREAQVVLFCVKTVDTESVARALVPRLAPNATLLSLQNGVDNADRIFAATGFHAIPAAVYVAAQMAGPGRVAHTGLGHLILGYRAGWPRKPELGPLAAMFEHAEIPCRISDCIEPELWSKMVMNCAYNAISALGRARYGRILQSEPAREIMRRAIAEAVAVARAEGIVLSEEALVEAAFRFGGMMPEAISSTAQDIARGKTTEINSLNGFVARRGRELGISTPVNETLQALVHLLERQERPGSEGGR
jgi:2-dehydropantoate 2-reductase